MNCRNCGSQIPDGKLYCPFCGEEVQLVPEYSSADMERVQLKRLEEEQERERQERERIAETIKRQRKPKPWAVALALVLAAAAAAGFSVGAFRMIRKHQEAQPAYLKVRARRAVDAGREEEAVEDLLKALSLTEGNAVELPLWTASLLQECGRDEEAMALLESFYEEHGRPKAVLEALLSALYVNGETEKADALRRENPSLP